MTQKKTTSKAKPRKKKTAVGKTAAKKRAPARKTSGAKPIRSAAKKTKARKKTTGQAAARPGFFAGIRRFVLRAVLAILLLGLPSAGAYMVWLDYQVREVFEGKRWAVPARVYAAPTALYSGMRLTPAELEGELRRLRYQSGDTYRPGGYLHRGNNVFDIHVRAYAHAEGRRQARRAQVSIRNNHLSVRQGGTVYLDPLEIGTLHPSRNEDRILVRLEEVPDDLLKILLAVEDRAFYDHFGLNPLAIIRAVFANAMAGGVVQGGSTLTQQLVKNLYLNSERSFSRKLKEALMAGLLEWRYSKEEILEAYLNEIYLGQDGGRAIHGFGLASRYYFDRPLKELRLSEQALLVGLVKGASAYNPRRYPERALKRRNIVLQVMRDQDMITEDEYRTASRLPLGVSGRKGARLNPYPAFMDLLRLQLRQDYREEDLTTEGLRIYTTLDPRAQQAAQQALERRVKELEAGRKLSSGVLQGAVVMTDAANGEVQALIGGRNANDVGFNRALAALRPIGSLVKPAVYLNALSRSDYSLTTMLNDRPVKLREAGGRLWTPKNFDGRMHGDVWLMDALARSYNLSTVHLGNELGIREVIKTLRSLGVRHELPEYPSLFLGAATLTPLEVTQMYQTLATGGYYTPLRTIRAVQTPQGETLSRYTPSLRATVDSKAVYLLNRAMQEAVRNGTGKSLSRWVSPQLNIAGKTGTTDDGRDSWFAGYGGDRLAVVWIGADDNRALSLTGGGAALTVWGRMMGQLEPAELKPTQPRGLVQASVRRNEAGNCGPPMKLPYRQGTQPAPGSFCRDAQQAPVDEEDDSGGMPQWLQRLIPW